MRRLELDYDQVNSYHVAGSRGLGGFPQTSSAHNNLQEDEIGTQSTTKH